MPTQAPGEGKSRRLPFEPESTAALRARYPAAVREVIDAEAVELGTEAHPGQLRRHVFDFPGGLRLIVSRERYQAGQNVLHISASAAESSDLYHRLATGVIGPFEFAAAASQAFTRISRWRLSLVPTFWAWPKGIPHWFVEEPAGDPPDHV